MSDLRSAPVGGGGAVTPIATSALPSRVRGKVMSTLAVCSPPLRPSQASHPPAATITASTTSHQRSRRATSAARTTSAGGRFSEARKGDILVAAWPPAAALERLPRALRLQRGLQCYE